jgi:Recombination endonuclease VII
MTKEEKRQRLNSRNRERYAADPAYKQRKLATNKKASRKPKALNKDNERTKERYATDEAYRIWMRLYQSERAAKKYGWAPCIATPEQLIEAYTGYCDCCGCHESSCKTRLVIDHDHDTGDFRGWLCNTCNLSIGKLGDTPEQVWAAYCYLAPSHSAIALQAFVQ